MKLRYFDLAKKLAVKSDHAKYQLGCVIVSKNKVLSLGFNQLKTHSKSPHKWKTLHAEIDALLGNSFEDLKGCEAYVYRQTKDGCRAMAKPCPVCELALKKAGIKKVYFTVDNELGYDYIDLRRI